MTQSSLRTEFLGRRCFNHPNVRVRFLFSVAVLQSVGARGTFLANRGFGAADAEQHCSPGDMETGEARCLPRGGPPFTGREHFLPQGRGVKPMHPTDASVWALWLGFSEDRICRTQTSPPCWSRRFCRGSWVRVCGWWCRIPRNNRPAESASYPVLSDHLGSLGQPQVRCQPSVTTKRRGSCGLCRCSASQIRD